MRSAQFGSFSEAARQLGMAPSAVSRAVLRLEDELGVRLLQRTTRSLTLTEEGDRFNQLEFFIAKFLVPQLWVSAVVFMDNHAPYRSQSACEH